MPLLFRARNNASYRTRTGQCRKKAKNNLGIDLVLTTRCIKEKRSNMKSIKELCSMTGTTENTLRYYYEKGLLSPAFRNQHGRREWCYDDESVDRLRVILLFRKIGLSVDDIKRLIEQMESGCATELLQKRLSELKTEREILDEKITITEVLVLVERIEEEDHNSAGLLDKLINTYIRGERSEERK